MSVDFLSKNFPPFQVHHAKKPPRFYPDGFQRNVIDFYFIFSDCRLRKALYLQFSYFIWPLCSIYTTRPEICSVDSIYEHYYKTCYTKEEFYQINMQGCEMLKKIYNR